MCIGNTLSQLPNTTLQHAIRFAFRQPAESIQFALGLTSFTPLVHCTLQHAVQSRTASFPHEVRFFLFHRLHRFASLTIVVTRLLVGCLSSLQHPKPPDFHCAFQGTLEPSGSTLPGAPKPKGWGPLAPKPMLCPPPNGVACPRSREQETATIPNEKITNQHQSPNIYPATLREVGPLNNNVREAPITTIMYSKNVLYNNSLLAPRT